MTVVMIVNVGVVIDHCRNQVWLAGLTSRHKNYSQYERCGYGKLKTLRVVTPGTHTGPLENVGG